MKRLISTVIILSLILALTSCGKNTKLNSEQNSVLPKSENSSAQNSVSSENKSLNETVYPIRSLKDSGIYSVETPEKVSNTDRPAVGYGMLAFAVNFTETERAVCLIDSDNGKLLIRTDASTENLLFGLWENGLWICKSNKISVMNKKGKTVYSAQLDTKDEMPAVNISSDGKICLWSDGMSGGHLLNLENGKSSELDDKVYFIEMQGFFGNRFLASDPTGKNYCVTINGHVAEIAKRQNAKIFGDKIIEGTRDGITISSLDATLERILYVDTDKDYPINAAGDYIFALRNDNLIIFNTQKELSSGEIGLGGIFWTSLSNEATSAVTADNGNDGTALYLIRMNEIKFSEKIGGSTSYNYSEDYEEYFETPDLSGKTGELIEKIYKEYNVHVFFKLNKRQNDELLFYSCAPFTGKTEKTVETLYNYLKLYPKDICRQMTDEKSDTWVLFTDEIQNTDGSASDVVGFSIIFGKHPLMALQVSNTDMPEDRIIAHEFTHLLEKGFSVEDLESWEKLSPENSYFGSYDYPAGADAMTYGTDKNKAYFIDAYARTFADEDRARTGEYGYLSYKNGAEEKEFSAPAIKNKLKELCRLIRKNYPCIKSLKEGSFFLEKYL